MIHTVHSKGHTINTHYATNVKLGLLSRLCAKHFKLQSLGANWTTSLTFSMLRATIKYVYPDAYPWLLRYFLMCASAGPLGTDIGGYFKIEQLSMVTVNTLDGPEEM